MLPIVVIVVLIALLVGYIWGKRDGLVYGNQQGTVNIPLLLRQQSLEKGYCLLCNKPKKKRMIYKLGEQCKKKKPILFRNC
jgi:hypothetical protein